MSNLKESSSLLQVYHFMSTPVKDVYCVDDPALAHATVIDDITRKIDSTVSMTCVDGYEVAPKGTDLEMECKPDTPEKGKWVGNGECKSMSTQNRISTYCYIVLPF